MRILVVNDDGIQASGIAHLARAAQKFGEVWVAAPDSQCSAMSHRISIFDKLRVRSEPNFEVKGVQAWSISGTPADCVKVALAYIMPERPDIVLSGINNSYNAGVDILYSGTVGAAMEALACGIPAMAFSTETCRDLQTADAYLEDIIKELLKREIAPYEIWNVNFPSCRPKEILYDRFPSARPCCEMVYTPEELPDGSVNLAIYEKYCTEAEEGSDARAILDGCISVGKLENALLRAAKRR